MQQISDHEERKHAQFPLGDFVLFCVYSSSAKGIVGASGGADAGGVRKSGVAQGVGGGNSGVDTALL